MSAVNKLNYVFLDSFTADLWFVLYPYAELTEKAPIC